MPRIQETIGILHGLEIEKVFSMLYGEKRGVFREQISRYEQVVRKYSEYYPDGDLQLFSSPGRTELGGNHTDHNGGAVLAASVDLDAVAAAARTDDPCITLYSQGFSRPFRVYLDDLKSRKEEERTTSSLIKGIAARCKDLGYAVGGLNAFVSSRVRVGSGLSSSASIEVLIGTMINTLYNSRGISLKTLAEIGQYAENVYFNKPCGLMDQLACAVGGIVSVDFRDLKSPGVEKVHFDFGRQGYDLLVVDTGGDHADLTEDYASVAGEMQEVARVLGGNVLRDVEFQDVLKQVRKLRSRVGDRAVLRAFHFFAENQRVFRQIDALENGDFEEFLRLVRESGLSSCLWLQNCYAAWNPARQGILLALALTRDYLKKAGRGACRVHGGGFEGTIQVFMPHEFLDEYVKMMKGVFGEESVILLDIRPLGAIHINSLL